MIQRRLNTHSLLHLAFILVIAGMLTTMFVAWGTPLAIGYFLPNDTRVTRDLPAPNTTLTINRTNGWPFPCTTSVETITTSTLANGFPLISTTRIFTLRVQLRPNTNGLDTVYLAYRPLFPGLLANTLLYAAAWLALCRLFLSLRARRRVRRNQCTKCTYDLQGSSTHCPECGHQCPAPAST